MNAKILGTAVVASLCLSASARADDITSQSVARMRAAVADVRDSYSQIRQVVTVARETGNPVALNCAWSLQEKTADVLRSALDAIRAAHTGKFSDSTVTEVVLASRDVASIEASAHLCLSAQEGVRAPNAKTSLPSGALAALNGRETLIRNAPEPIRGWTENAEQ